jgi:hypothetical protein
MDHINEELELMVQVMAHGLTVQPRVIIVPN